MSLEEWQQLHQHYNNIKKKYHLFNCDIAKQLNISKFTVEYYLRPEAYYRNISNKPGTNAYNLRYVFKENLNRNWSHSMATYDDLLYEYGLVNDYIHAYRVNAETDAIPQLKVDICINEGPVLTKEQLIKHFTIGNIIPDIVSIDISRWCI